MIMSGSQRITGEAFAIERLRKDPNLDYSALRRLAAEAGVSMQPIQYGRARKSLGLPPVREARLEEAPPALPLPPMARIVAATPAATTPIAIVQDGDAMPAQPQDKPPVVVSGGASPRSAPPSSAIVAPRRKGSDAFDFLVQELRREPTLIYGVLRERCEAKGWKIAPIMYGRAKAVLGLVPVKPRGTAKKAAEAAVAAAAVNAPRPVFKQVESVAGDRFTKQLEEVRNLEQLVAVVKELDGERRRLRQLLDRIVTMIDTVLG